MDADLAAGRELGIIEFHRHSPGPGTRHWLVRSQNFFVEWAEAGRVGSTLQAASSHETMVLVFGHAARVTWQGKTVQAPPRSACIVPAGGLSVDLDPGGSSAVLASQRDDLGQRLALNQADFTQADPRVQPFTPPFCRLADAGAIRVWTIDSFQAPASNPRLKMLQSATLSINWVDYDGPRDRRSLSPHSHADLEQGSLAVAGRFVHHLRQPWGRDADLWREDRHIEVGSPSMLVVPVNLTHTSEGVGPGPHLLIDVFSPPRVDFIAKAWVHNAADYRAPTA